MTCIFQTADQPTGSWTLPCDTYSSRMPWNLASNTAGLQPFSPVGFSWASGKLEDSQVVLGTILTMGGEMPPGIPWDAVQGSFWSSSSHAASSHRCFARSRLSAV